MISRSEIFQTKHVMKAVALLLFTFLIYSCASLKSSDYLKRIKAVNRITDQGVLYNVVMEDNNPEVRIAAFNRITDQDLIGKLATESRDADIRLSAVGRIEVDKIAEESILYVVAMIDTDLEIRIAAFNRIISQLLINMLAERNNVIELRLMAVNKVTDQEILYTIARYDPSLKVSVAAMKMLEPDLIKKLANENLNKDQYLELIELLNDQQALFDITLNHYYVFVKLAAIRKIYDQDYLSRLAIESNDESVRLYAINTLADQYILYKIALEDKSYIIKEAAMKRLEPDYMTRLAADFPDQALKLKVVSLLNDQTGLMNISLTNDDWTVRQAAFEKLNDASLSKIIHETKDPAVILASKIRLGLITWSEAFSIETSSKGKLGDVIGAAALVDSPQPTSEDVVEACHNFIRRGDASRIPELINLLNRFGDVTLAEDYINCGHEKLYDAGAEWGNAHGYYISTGYGSNRVRWGEKR